MNKPLSEHQKLFAVCYASNGGKGSQAARDAGYSQSREAAVRLLNTPRVVDLIRSYTEKKLADTWT